MRIMGLDIGSKTIGVAVCDPLGITAQGIKTIRRENIKKDITEIVALIEEYGVEKIVAGYPRKLDNTPGPMCEEVDRVCNKLKKRVDMEIIYQDERFTTSAAQRVLLEADLSRAKRKQVVDTVAASFILQTYLDSVNK